MDPKKRLVWFILVRVMVVTLFLLATIILNMKDPESIGSEVLSGFIRLITATYLFSLLSLLALRVSERRRGFLTSIQIIWDLILVTVLLLLTGGVSSPFSFLYFLAIINASFLLARREAIYTASLCAILYGSIVDMQYYGKLVELGLSPIPALQYGPGHLFYSVFINIVAFYLTAIVSGYLSERAITSETALQEKAIDFEELERLNSLIVSNLGSGLVTINTDGRIRVLNPYAAGILAISLKEAYDRPLHEIFPLHFLESEPSDKKRKEIVYLNPEQKRYILECKAIPFADREGNPVGTLIEIQDLTHLKKIEAELKKADRLAAIGEMSAHMAHEIRNPLASISGSVQLIANGGNVGAGDRKLLEIVLRESDRLNGLITEFLSYARPVQPQKMSLSLRQVIVDLELLLKRDPRFQKVKIVNDCPEGVRIEADPDQFQQVFWNLAVNAAESMPGGGEIIITAMMVDTGAVGIRLGDMVKVEVRDNGPGMPKEVMEKVFDPFFTTKPGGTGLGLATVYRVVESHGGMTTVNSELGEGTVFTLLIPAATAGDKG